MSSELWIYIILAIIFIISLIIIIAWITVLKTLPTFPPAPVYSTAGFGMRCSDTEVEETTNSPTTYIPPPCATGLVCSNGFCLKDIGSSCTSIFECVPNSIICNGYCSSTGRTGLNGQCSTNEDCDLSFVCDTTLVPAVCKRPIGSSPCIESTDCVSDAVCLNNVCVPISETGQGCIPVTDANTCITFDHCLDFGNNYYFCQPDDITVPGSESSVCFYWNDTSIPQPAPPIKNVTIDSVLMTVPTCLNGLQCNAVGSLGNDNSDIIPTYGECGNLAGWFDQCSTLNGCQPPQVCISDICTYPAELINNLVELQPLSCLNGNSTGLCLNNYECNRITNMCQGISNGIPAVNNNSCVNGIGGYNVVIQEFQNIDSDPTNRLETASWNSAGLIVPSTINDSNINQVNFSTFEKTSGVINAIFHIIGNNFYVISTPTGNTTITISNISGRIVNVGYTTTGNYYCVAEYSGFANLYLSTLANFSDIIILATNSYSIHYYSGSVSMIFRSGYIYSVSVDDRSLNSNVAISDVRIFLVTGNNGPYTSTQLIQQGSLISARIIAPNLATVSYSLSSQLFDLLSYTNSGTIDATLVWCQAFLSRTIDVNLASKYCIGYRAGDNTALAYGPNPYSLSNVANTPGVFPVNRFYVNFTMNQITMYNSRSTDLFNDPCYYVANQGQNNTQVSQIYLGLSFASENVFLPGDVNLNTKLSVPIPSPILDVPNYIPKITILTRVCN